MPYFTLYQGALRSDNCQNKPKPFILWEFGQAVLKIPHRILFPYFIFSTKSFPNNADKQTIHLPFSASPFPPFLGFYVQYMLFGGTLFLSLIIFGALLCCSNGVVIYVNIYNREQTAFVPDSFLFWSVCIFFYLAGHNWTFYCR